MAARKHQKITRDAVLVAAGIGFGIYGLVWSKEGLTGTLVTLILGWTLSPVALRVDEAIGRAKAKKTEDAP